jgi:hypothetical protein
MGKRSGIRKIIDGDEFDILPVETGPEDKSSDPSKTVDGDLHGHIDLPLFFYNSNRKTVSCQPLIGSEPRQQRAKDGFRFQVPGSRKKRDGLGL